jgi:choline dehydrogenase-like flavoprotein
VVYTLVTYQAGLPESGRNLRCFARSSTTHSAAGHSGGPPNRGKQALLGLSQRGDLAGIQGQEPRGDQVIPARQAYLHMTSSAPMGRDDDPRAVVDENGIVRRVNGLYAGASIMPDTPSVAINPTVILMAEIVADRIKAANS